MQNPTGLIPDHLLRPESYGEMFAWLRARPLPASLKVSLLLGWGRLLQVKIPRADQESVRASGVDA